MRRALLAAIFAALATKAGAQSLPTKGANQYSAIAPNNTTGVQIKASAGLITGIQMGSIASGSIYLKLYDKATPPVCGTDTPVKRIPVPEISVFSATLAPLDFPVGIKFNFGIGYCVTVGLADSDITAPDANTVITNIDWN